jgi:hypothetical protein
MQKVLRLELNLYSTTFSVVAMHKYKPSAVRSIARTVEATAPSTALNSKGGLESVDDNQCFRALSSQKITFLSLPEEIAIQMEVYSS